MSFRIYRVILVNKRVPLPFASKDISGSPQAETIEHAVSTQDAKSYVLFQEEGLLSG